ncbi:core histone macro-H2A.1 [Trichonephila clavipes]|nr:core histone macro-H2A.1 [Trichonephila clavipes]
MSEWDYTNERVLFWMDLNGDFEWVCSTITSQNIYGRTPMIILLTMRPSRIFVKIRCHAVASTEKDQQFSPRRAHTLGNKPKKRQARMRWRQVNIVGQGGS